MGGGSQNDRTDRDRGNDVGDADNDERLRRALYSGGDVDMLTYSSRTNRQHARTTELVSAHHHRYQHHIEQ